VCSNICRCEFANGVIWQADIGVNSKDYKPFFPFIGNGPKLIGDTLVRTKTLYVSYFSLSYLESTD
jgi:hypothetical protein